MLISDPCPEEQRSKSWPLAVFAPEPDRTGKKDGPGPVWRRCNSICEDVHVVELRAGWCSAIHGTSFENGCTSIYIMSCNRKPWSGTQDRNAMDNSTACESFARLGTYLRVSGSVRPGAGCGTF